MAVIALGAFVTKIVEAVNKQREFNQLLEKGSAADLAEELDIAKEKADKLIKSLEKLGTNRSDAGTAKRLARNLEKANEDKNVKITNSDFLNGLKVKKAMNLAIYKMEEGGFVSKQSDE